MIRVDNLHFSFSSAPLFSGLDFDVKTGEILSIIGPNGCGKSTLLRLLRGNLGLTAGQIFWDKTPVADISAQTMARQVAVVPQSTHIDFPYKVREVVSMGRYPHRKSLLSFSTREDRSATSQALALTDIAHLSERPVTQLSGGELQRVFIARALAQSTRVLFLDEATSHLDIDHRLEISELLIRLNKEQNTTIVQVSHDLDMASAMSDRILLLSEHGEKVGIAAPADIMTAEALHQVFRVNVRVEENPLTGAPMIFPLINSSIHQLKGLRVHLFCGGGSGSSLMRKFHLAGATITAGPLNQGDADEALARALDLTYTWEEPFSPYSEASLIETEQLLEQADAVILATRWWGQGNLGCLTLAEKALARGTEVLILGTHQPLDYTQGQARQLIKQLQENGTPTFASDDALMTFMDDKTVPQK